MSDVHFDISLSADAQRRGRTIKFTPERMEQIRNLVARGMPREEIAETIGVTVGSLQVTCSRVGLSLRRPRSGISIDRVISLKPPPCDETIDPTDTTDPADPTDPTDPTDPAPITIEVPPATPVAPVFTFVMSYRGRKRITPLSLTDEEIATLAIEAEIRGMRIGELIAKLICSIARRGMYDFTNKNGGVL